MKAGGAQARRPLPRRRQPGEAVQASAWRRRGMFPKWVASRVKLKGKKEFSRLRREQGILGGGDRICKDQKA